MTKRLLKKKCEYPNKDLRILAYFTPFRIEDAQSNRSNPFISAPKGGILNENWCNTGHRTRMATNKLQGWVIFPFITHTTS
jgi:hypothetical protein